MVKIIGRWFDSNILHVVNPWWVATTMVGIRHLSLMVVIRTVPTGVYRHGWLSEWLIEFLC